MAHIDIHVLARTARLSHFHRGQLMHLRYRMNGIIVTQIYAMVVAQHS